ELLGWSISTGHNSFLDIWLELGVVGLVISALAMMVFMRDAWRTLRLARVAPARWALVFAGVTLLLSLSHSVIAVQNGLFWFLQVAFTVWMRRAWLRVSPGGERYDVCGSHQLAELQLPSGACR